MKNEISAAIQEYMVGVRRHIHRNPELSKSEYNTQKYIMNQLTKMGIENRKVAETGVEAFIPGSSEHTIAFRADMDALSIQEETGAEYASIKDGVSHACGHDAHCAILLGLAYYLKDENKYGNVKLLFQPDEEDTAGALRMIRDGCLVDVDRIFGLHVMPYLKSGQIEYKHGEMNANSTTIEITVNGISAHAAYPNEGIDVIYVISSLVVNLQSIISRNFSPFKSAVLSFGQINGGTAHNQLPESASIRGTLRTLSKEDKRNVESRVMDIIKGFEMAYNVNIDLKLEDGYAALINGDCTYVIEKKVFSKYDDNTVFLKKTPSLGVEDFAYYLEEVDGMFVHLGCGNETLSHPLHSSKFNIAEECMSYGLQFYLDCLEVYGDE